MLKLYTRNHYEYGLRLKKIHFDEQSFFNISIQPKFLHNNSMTQSNVHCLALDHRCYLCFFDLGKLVLFSLHVGFDAFVLLLHSSKSCPSDTYEGKRSNIDIF